MEPISLWRYIASALQTPIVIPIVLMLIPRWRYSTRSMILRTIGIEALVIGLTFVFYFTLGPTVLSGYLVGLALPPLCFFAFWTCCSLRDSRLFFLMVTICLDTALCDALASTFFLRGDPRWSAVKVGVTVVHGLLLVLFCRRPLLEMLESNRINWIQTSIIPLSLWALAQGFYTYAVLRSQGKMPALPVALLTGSSILIYLALYRFQRATLEQAEARQYSALLRSEVSFLEREAVQAEAAERNAHILRHDLRHYARLLRGCLDAGDVASAREVVDMLEQNADGLTIPGGLRRYTGRPILDTVLTQAAQRAKREGVEFEAHLCLPETLNTDETELAVVVANALENALNAVSKEPAANRWVCVQGKSCGSQVLLECSNSFSGELRLDKRTGLPRSEVPGHGYGTQSIANFARKHGCTLDCTAQDGTFRLRMLL